MKKLIAIFIILFLCAALCVAFLIGRDLIAKVVLEKAIYSVSGLKLSIGKAKTGLVKSYIRLEDLKLMNPAGFPEGIMFDVPLLYVEYDIRSLFNRRLHIKDMEFHLKKLNVIKNRDGKVNLNSMNMIKDYIPDSVRVKDAEGVPAVIIDRVHLKGASVTYQNLAGSVPETREFDVDVDEVYEDVDDPYTVGRLIVSRALRKTGVAQLAGFDLGLLQQGLGGIATTSARVVNHTAKGAMGFSQRFTQAADGIFKKMKGALGGGER